jgi:hypothetical protein
MNLMLVVIMMCVVLGLAAKQFAGRQKLFVASLATVMTTLYFFVARFV